MVNTTGPGGRQLAGADLPRSEGMENAVLAGRSAAGLRGRPFG